MEAIFEGNQGREVAVLQNDQPAFSLDAVQLHFEAETEEGPLSFVNVAPGSFESTDGRFCLHFDIRPLDEARHQCDVKLTRNDGRLFVLKRFEVYALVPMIDLHRIKVAERSSQANQLSRCSYIWWLKAYSASNIGSPFILGYNREGNNKFLMGFVDQKPGTELRHEKRNHLPDQVLTKLTQFVICRPFPGETYTTKAFLETVYISLADNSYEDEIRRYAKFVEDKEALEPLAAPEHCLSPVWCSWYAYRNGVTQAGILSNATIAKTIGVETIIIDLGWFIPELEPWCTYAGSWSPAQDKFPDLPGLINQIQRMGLRCMLWVSPPLLGQKAKCFDRQEQLLAKRGASDEISWLCPKSKESAEVMADVCEQLMRTYNPDGLKIDFLDQVRPVQECAGTHPHQFDTFGEGMAHCMRRMSEAILAVKPDAIIEYRQDYANIYTRQFANCFRGNDAPYDFDHIRRETALLAPLHGQTPIHSDYALWHEEESLPNKAIMLASIMMGSVPTLSHNLTALPQGDLDLIVSWLRFYRQWQDVLTVPTPVYLSHDAHYSLVRLSREGKTVLGIFTPISPATVKFPQTDAEAICLINGTNENHLRLRVDLGQQAHYKASIRNPLLQEIKRQTVLSNIQGQLDIDLDVPKGGQLILRKERKNDVTR